MCPTPLLAALFAAGILSALPADASCQAPGANRDGPSGDNGGLELSLAYLDVSGGQGEALALESLYRPGSPRLWVLQPMVGGALYTDGSAYAHLGVRLPLAIGQVVAEPSFGIGGFHRGTTLNLGSPVQFRSGVSLAYRLPEGGTISLYLYHLSNAGLSEMNPGVEVLGVGYAFPRFR